MDEIFMQTGGWVFYQSGLVAFELPEIFLKLLPDPGSKQ